MEETDWLQVESYVRRVVQSLIQPTIRRELQNRKQIQDFKKAKSKIDHTLQQVHYNMVKLQRRFQTIDDLARRQFTLQNTVRIATTKFNQDKDHMVGQVDILTKTITTLEQNVKVLDDQRIDMNIQIGRVTDALTSQKLYIDGLINVFRDDFRQRIIKLEQSSGLQHQKIQHITNKQLTDSSLLAQLDVISRRAGQLTQECLESQSVIQKEFHQFKQETYDSIKYAKEVITNNSDKMRETQKMLDQFIMLENPIKQVLGTIDILYELAGSLKERRKIAKLEQGYFAQWYELPLTNSLMEEIEEARIRNDEIMDQSHSSDSEDWEEPEGDFSEQSQENQEDTQEDQQKAQLKTIDEEDQGNERQKKVEMYRQQEEFNGGAEESKRYSESQELKIGSQVNLRQFQNGLVKEVNSSILQENKAISQISSPMSSSRLGGNSVEISQSAGQGGIQGQQEKSVQGNKQIQLSRQNQNVNYLVPPTEDIGKIKEENSSKTPVSLIQSTQNQLSPSLISQQPSSHSSQVLTPQNPIQKAKSYISQTKKQDLQQKQLPLNRQSPTVSQALIQPPSIQSYPPSQIHTPHQSKPVKKPKKKQIQKPKTPSKIKQTSIPPASPLQRPEKQYLQTQNPLNQQQLLQPSKISPTESSSNTQNFQSPIQNQALPSLAFQPIQLVAQSSTPSNNPIQIVAQLPSEEAQPIQLVAQTSLTPSQPLKLLVQTPQQSSNTQQKQQKVPPKPVQKKTESLKPSPPKTKPSARSPVKRSVTITSSPRRSRVSPSKEPNSPTKHDFPIKRASTKPLVRRPTISSRRTQEFANRRQPKSDQRTSAQLQKMKQTIDDIRHQFINTSKRINQQIVKLQFLTNRQREIDEKLDRQSSNHILDIQQTLQKLELFQMEFDTAQEFMVLKYDQFKEDIIKRTKTLQVLIQQSIYQCNASVIQRRRDHSDNSSQFRKLWKHHSNMEQIQDSHKETLDKYKKVLDLLIECSKINIQVQLQDEADRESIALFGVKNRMNKGGQDMTKPILTLDKRCLSCSGQASAVVSAYKVACLAYAPSKVQYGYSVYDRKSLLKVEQNMVQSIWDNSVVDLENLLVNNREISTTNSVMRPLSHMPPQFTSSPLTPSELPPLSHRSNRSFQFQ